MTTSFKAINIKKSTILKVANNINELKRDISASLTAYSLPNTKKYEWCNTLTCDSRNVSVSMKVVDNESNVACNQFFTTQEFVTKSRNTKTNTPVSSPKITTRSKINMI